MLTLYGESFSSRLLVGTACYPSLEILCAAILASHTEIITVALKRELNSTQPNRFWETIQKLNKKILPNTAGCHCAKDAITTAEMAREIFHTNWIKLEVIGDDYLLHPDPFELVQATKELIARGFKVLPYCTDDLILCQRLVDLGCDVLMPWGAPIGSGKGIINSDRFALLRMRFPTTSLIIDAGIGKPSHAAQALELGADAVLLNTAIAKADDPVQMASAINHAVQAGRLAFEAGMIPVCEHAIATTPLVDTPFWQQKECLHD